METGFQEWLRLWPFRDPLLRGSFYLVGSFTRLAYVATISPTFCV